MGLLSGWQIAGGLILLIAGLIGVIVWLSGKRGEDRANSRMQTEVGKKLWANYENERKIRDHPLGSDDDIIRKL